MLNFTVIALRLIVFFGRYDYLEFTDARGGKVRYDMKVGTEKWPKVWEMRVFTSTWMVM